MFAAISQGASSGATSSGPQSPFLANRTTGPSSGSVSRLASISSPSGTAPARVFSSATLRERNGHSRIACTNGSSEPGFSEPPWASRQPVISSAALAGV